MGRLQRAGAQQHLARGFELLELAGLLKLHAHRTFVLQQDAGGVGVGEHLQIGPRAVGAQVGLGRAVAFSVLVGDLVQANPFLFWPIEVRVQAVTGLLRGFDEHRSEAVRAAQVHHVERATRAVQGIATALIVLGALEVGQHVIEAPARVALGGPLVVVPPVPAQVNHGVDRAGAAQHLAPGLITLAAIETALRDGVELPVGLTGLG